MRNNQGWKGRIWRFFTSVRVTIFLLIILAITSISGTLIAQRASPKAYMRIFGEKGYGIIKVLGLYDVYHSWWFIFLLGLLALNLIICSIERLPRAWRFVRHPDKWPPPETLEEYHHKIKVTTNLPLDEAGQILSQKMRNKGCKVELKGEEKELRLFAQKGVINRLSTYITHLSVLIILLGGIIDGLFGFSGSMTIVEGESSRNVTLFGTNRVISLPFDVKCKSFEIEYYPGTKMPKEYRSVITILNDGKPSLTKVVRVNHPLKFRGINFYQASYGTLSTTEGLLTLKVASPQNSSMVKLRVGETLPLEDGYQLHLVAFYPDLVVGPGNQPMNRSDKLRNPAALLEVKRDGKMLYRSWVFAFFPNIHSLKNVPFRFKYVSFRGLQYTGLQVSKDPGVWVVWLGCILILVGLIATFFISHKRFWIHIEERGKRRVVLLVGNTNRNHSAFSQFFEELGEEIKSSVAKIR